ncbi:MAG: glucose-6-phosphate isomerase family protein [Candidatus Aenigmatarchaeota archaeon]
MPWQTEIIKTLTPDIRRALDMKEVIFDKGWLRSSGNPELYYMYRGVSKPEDAELIKKAGLRYDITVIPPLMMGQEFVKTAGHYHPEAVPGFSYMEVYQVLEGEAIYLIQWVDDFEKNEVVDAAFAKAGPGDVFVVPSNYGHITINPSDKHRLVMINWTATGFKSDYGPIEKMGGGAWLYTKDRWIKNPKYGEVPELRELKAKKMPDLYSLVKNLKKLEFLKDPRVEPGL